MSRPPVRLIETSPAGHALSELATLDFQEGLGNDYGRPVVMVHPEARFQRFHGFGGAFTEAAGWALSHLSEEAQQALMDAYFNPVTGLGYTFGRTHINSCDFSLENWACAETPDDWELRDGE